MDVQRIFSASASAEVRMFDLRYRVLKTLYSNNVKSVLNEYPSRSFRHQYLGDDDGVMSMSACAHAATTNCGGD